jgi:nitrite reductase/ring-hydroxylating ferredoxin subunit
MASLPALRPQLRALLPFEPTMPWHPTTIAAEPTAASGLQPVRVAGQAIVLAAYDGRWYAIEDRCSHAGCAFSEDAEIDGERVICDCHGSEFDVRTGQVLRGPAEAPIATFPARTGSGVVEVEL